jgi:hypothetical protein
MEFLLIQLLDVKTKMEMLFVIKALTLLAYQVLQIYHKYP